MFIIRGIMMMAVRGSGNVIEGLLYERFKVAYGLDINTARAARREVIVKDD